MPHPDPPHAPPRRLGDFEILGELGRGGMGVVYEARQVSLNRKVALKVLSSTVGLSGKAVLRFRREAEAAAKLHHTNIVPIYATGEENGAYFYAMELIEGPSLDRVLEALRRPQAPATGASNVADSTGDNLPAWVAQTIDHVPAPVTASGVRPALTPSSVQSGAGYFDTVARLVAEVADALEYAHGQGVIHRDIKPSNLLLSPAGRLAVNDFGLARLLEQPGMTLTGEFVGTPAYMSPEQITAGRVPLDHRTDIYSLGATLYELLTWQRPFPGHRREQVLAQVLHKDPPPPRRLDRRIPVDLETICLKAMDKDPDRRYQTAGQMAQDLRCYLNRFAISARRAGPVARGVKWVRRRPGVAALLGCLLVAVAVAGYFAWQAKQAGDRLAEDQRQAALERAILQAMSGDEAAALQAIADAEARDAPPGQLNLLRGFVEYQRGRPREAMVYLEQAERQLPGSVAVKALLAQAHCAVGQWSQMEELLAASDGLQPQTSEDYLFLGMAQAVFDPDKGLRTLDKALERPRPWPLARLLRGSARTQVAMMTGTVQDADKALDDLRKVDLPDGPLLVGARVFATLVALHAHDSKSTQRPALLRQVAEDVELLARYPDVPTAVVARCNYFVFLDDDEALLREVRAARRHHPDSALDYFELHVLYRRKQFAEALAFLEASQQNWTNEHFPLTRGMVLASLPGRQREAEEAILSAVRQTKGGSNLAMFPGPLHWLGPEGLSKCKKLSRDLRTRQSHTMPRWRDGWYHHLLAFHAGDLSAEELLARAGKSRFNLCEAYYYIANRKLAELKRGEAREFYRRSYETGVYLYGEYQWSRSVLAVIDDPAWMPWCPPEAK
jgi:serine/threonine protein kinase/predicted negative regulator of RcsB-dependent stress response